MPTYLYQGYDATGRHHKGRVEALHPKEAREHLLQQGIYVRQLRAAHEARRARSTARHRAIVYRELAALLSAGLPVDRALAVLVQNPELAALSPALSTVRDRVREGEDLSRALSNALPGLREYDRAVLEAGETAGKLPRVCSELADFLDDDADIRDRIQSALVYPLVVVFLALIALGILVGVLLPTYERLFRSMGETLPPLTRGVLAAGRVLRSPAGTGAFLLVLLWGVWRWRRPRGRRSPLRDRVRFRLPVLGAMHASLARVRFARTLALLLEGGVPVHHAFRIAGRATGSDWLAGECERQGLAIEQGGRLADVVQQIPILQEDLPGWLQASEATGEVPELLRHAAQGHHRAWERHVTRSLALLEPLLIICVGLLILLVALAVLLPMLQLNRTLGT